jgi:hypothetical protein
MTVRELIALLAGMDPDRVVILQKDAEGNGYSPLRARGGVCDDSVYIAESTWRGEVKYATLTPELEASGYGEEDCAEAGEGVPCVVLVPIN